MTHQIQRKANARTSHPQLQSETASKKVELAWNNWPARLTHMGDTHALAAKHGTSSHHLTKILTAHSANNSAHTLHILSTSQQRMQTPEAFDANNCMTGIMQASLHSALQRALITQIRAPLEDRTKRLQSTWRTK